MREITTHHTNEANKAISITADERDEANGNASHNYVLRWHEADESGCEIEVDFQHGPIDEVGVNGVTNEALLAVIIDRLEGFQSSKYACPENAAALQFCARALQALQERTRQRQARGVEGTHAV